MSELESLAARWEGRGGKQSYKFLMFYDQNLFDIRYNMPFYIVFIIIILYKFLRIFSGLFTVGEVIKTIPDYIKNPAWVA